MFPPVSGQWFQLFTSIAVLGVLGKGLATWEFVTVGNGQDGNHDFLTHRQLRRPAVYVPLSFLCLFFFKK